MKNLYLTYAETRRLHGNDTYNRPSRFLQEIPSELVSEVRMKGAVERPYGGEGNGGLFEDPSAALKMGQRVLHQKFGEGVVLRRSILSLDRGGSEATRRARASVSPPRRSG